ncbi:tannase/feruloyl esterase family alpha/beta hydrolase [Amycolatopsis alba DSM 44262]|uniref:Tannase/feruloyl esterase family alpha/beta hydrolase n=1 Tax=Amycolatopsis alba DSM 44262 TaxID=1125972 RepID=A0A229S7T9_AMYAL|nr:tannase/feruloyl esterase family alpha/beta hydrolase [Amycolatopsis alba DSM 44262]
MLAPVFTLAVLAACAPATVAEAPVRDCQALVRAYDIPGATAKVTSATVRSSGPERCEVTGRIAPAVTFRLALPVRTYGGRYLQYGCGGFCGEVSSPAVVGCGEDTGDAAVAATDDGHAGPAMDGSWALRDQAARDDFAFRAPHVLSLVAKQIITAYYGTPPKKSYFRGCSNGGREGMLLAQRYPRDFDGVLASSPAISILQLGGIYQTWLVRSNTGASGGPIIDATAAGVLHEAVLGACDGLDGLIDGQLEDPRLCEFDPATIRCEPGSARRNCLTAAQTEAAQRLYAGPTDGQGRRLFPGRQPFGGELGWPDWFGQGDSGTSAVLAENHLRYLDFPIGTPHSSLAGFGFTVGDYERLVPESVKINALGLDLTEFHRAGGRLVIEHGWADQGVPPSMVIDYYARLAQRNGGLENTRSFARLFLVPTLYHCGGGELLTRHDAFPELVHWVETGRAPDRTIAEGHGRQGNARTRPVFAYPERARYDGSGSIDDESNFTAAPPLVNDSGIVRWLGEDLYDRRGPVAPG